MYCALSDHIVVKLKTNHFRLIWTVPHRPPLLLVDIKESIYIRRRRNAIAEVYETD